jgi:phosphoribosylamine--glycine ligase
MNILILGHGGREHALVDIIKKSSHTSQLFVLNGNPGMKKDAINLTGLETKESILSICKNHHIDLVIPGGESYLSDGITDELISHGITCFGPTQKASFIESSKAYAKLIMEKYDIPTASYKKFYDSKDALSYLHKLTPPYVIKYDGLALGKGVTVTSDFDEATQVILLLLDQKIYGNDGVLIEEFLYGKEYSMIAAVHEKTVVVLPVARDHKSRYDDNQGPNTGGMGAYSPVDFVTEDIYKLSLDILNKCALGMCNENNAFTGFLYGGFILTEKGPKVIEFNCRLGDPEAEVILPRIKTDFVELLLSVLSHKPISPIIDSDYQLGVVMVSAGYPNDYRKGYDIQIDSSVEQNVYHMGTAIIDDKLVTHGGRVLLVRGTGKTLLDAHKEAYRKIDKIVCHHLRYRYDIGKYNL